MYGRIIQAEHEKEDAVVDYHAFIKVFYSHILSDIIYDIIDASPAACAAKITSFEIII